MYTQLLQGVSQGMTCPRCRLSAAYVEQDMRNKEQTRPAILSTVTTAKKNLHFVDLMVLGICIASMALKSNRF